MHSHTSRLILQARQSGYGDTNLGSCVRIPPAYALWVSDWVGTGQFYMRSSPGSLWFVQEVRGPMQRQPYACASVRLCACACASTCAVTVRLC